MKRRMNNLYNLEKSKGFLLFAIPVMSFDFYDFAFDGICSMKGPANNTQNHLKGFILEEPC
jgi:hypothetical protein